METGSVIRRAVDFILLTIVAVLITFLTTSFFTEEEISIHDAVNKKLIQIEASSTGSHSGEAIKLLIKNLSNKSCKINIPAGTMFVADINEEQNIFVPNSSVVLLKGNENKNLIVEGYCSESSDQSPAPNSTFKLTFTDNKNLIKLTQLMKDKKLSPSIKQEAVWCAANGDGLSNLNLDNDVQTASNGEDIRSLREAIASEMNIPNNWYNTQRRTEVNENREIVYTPVEVRGKISIYVNKACDVSQKVMNEKGEVVDNGLTPFHVPRALNMTYEFSLKVSGWEKGKYFVIVNAGEKEILKQEFEI